MNSTGFKDINGVDIKLGDTVLYKGEFFEVEVNPFAERVVIDNDYGQCWLADAYEECEVIIAVFK